ncbi:pannexin-3 [Protopterus annectens]|uniref:pannexin-3 n=1 Tax=Protopterus annectens TaxID=7888 RepID=UPI001CFA7925|nr:pannexin-3 [Protopterus annectens]
MSIASAAAEFMLSDSLLPSSKGSRTKRLRFELPADRIIKYVSVGLPLLLVSLAFAREITKGSQITCLTPSNFTLKQTEYIHTYCWDSLTHHELDDHGTINEKSLWIHKIFPYSLLVIGVLMYLPALLWGYLAETSLGCDLIFLIDELDKSYNRAVRLTQHIMKIRQECPDPGSFWNELEKARRERYFEFPLLERYMECKQRTHFLVLLYFLRNFLLLALITSTCLYLGYFHVQVFFLEEFNCLVKTGLLMDDPIVPNFIQCKLVSLSMFQIISVINGVIYFLLVPVVSYNLIKLYYWDKRLLNVYEMLPAFDLLSRKMLGCPINDLNVILLFLRANVSEIKSFSRLNVLYTLKDTNSVRHHIDTIVDFMTILAGVEVTKPKTLPDAELGTDE